MFLVKSLFLVISSSDYYGGYVFWGLLVIFCVFGEIAVFKYSYVI